jgi:hypothetical protein
LAARYCIRQDANGFIELWLLSVALAGAAVAILLSTRRGIGDRRQRRIAFFWVGALACFLLFTGGFALTIFRWCYESAAPSLGMVLPNAPGKSLDTMICLSPHALAMIHGWILIVVACVAATGLLVLGFQLKGAVRRAVSIAGGALALLFAAANGGLMVFSASWCQSGRLF